MSCSTWRCPGQAGWLLEAWAGLQSSLGAGRGGQRGVRVPSNLGCGSEAAGLRPGRCSSLSSPWAGGSLACLCAVVSPPPERFAGLPREPKESAPGTQHAPRGLLPRRGWPLTSAYVADHFVPTSQATTRWVDCWNKYVRLLWFKKKGAEDLKLVIFTLKRHWGFSCFCPSYCKGKQIWVTKTSQASAFFSFAK